MEGFRVCSLAVYEQSSIHEDVRLMSANIFKIDPGVADQLFQMIGPNIFEETISNCSGRPRRQPKLCEFLPTPVRSLTLDFQSFLGLFYLVIEFVYSLK